MRSMRLSRQQWAESVGGVVGLAIAYAGYFLGSYAYGRDGVAVLVVSVPAGVAIGLVVAKTIVNYRHRAASAP